MSIFKSDGNHIILNTDYCEFYIPLYYFDSTKRFAEDFRDYISVLGIFNVGIFENGKFSKLSTFNIPTFIELKVYDSEERIVSLAGDEEVPCKVCKYYKGNIICNSTLIEDSSNVELFLNMIISGSLPKTIPYNKALDIWRKNLELNKVSFGVSSTVLELLLSVMYRNKDKPEEKFSKKIGKDSSVSEYDYQMVNIRQVCQYASTFTAVTFEDIDSMLTTSLNRTREKKKETESPIEKVIKM